MTTEVKELQGQLKKLESEHREQEENLQLVLSPAGKVGKDIKELKKRVAALEEAIMGTHTQHNKSKKNNKETE